MDGRRVTEEFKDEETRGALTAERAVAPLVIATGGELEDVLRRIGGVARPGRAGGAVVAILV